MMYVSLVALGLTAGYLGGLLGLGGGVILVPGLVYLFGFPIHKALGISLAVIVPTALAGAIKHGIAGNYDISVTLTLVVGAVCGSYLGVSSANLLPADTLRRVFGIFLILIGLNALFDWSGKLIEKRVVGARPATEEAATEEEHHG